MADPDFSRRGDPDFPRRGKRVHVAECMRRWRMDPGNAAVRILAENWKMYLEDPGRDKYPAQAVFLNYQHHITMRQGMLVMFSNEESTELLKKAQMKQLLKEEYEEQTRSTGEKYEQLPHWTSFGVFVEMPSF